jgi:dephospho-CoA kinase
MLRIGLTGGIASGKSTVADLLRQAGIPVIDADVLARRAVAPGSPALDAIRRRFPSVVDEQGRLDREALGRVVFSDPAARADLNAIVHPAVRRLAHEEMAEAERRGERAAVYDVPLLFEAGLEGDFDLVVVVNVPPAVQLERLMRRDGRSRQEAEDRIRAQMALSDKARRAGLVIDNGGSLEETRRQVDALITRLEGSP